MVTGRVVVPRATRRPGIGGNTRRQQLPAGGGPGDERRHGRSAQALPLSWIGTTRRCRRSPDSQVCRSHPAFPGRWAQWRRGFELPGHSGEDRVGLSPTSRSCIAVASVAADREAARLRGLSEGRRSVSQPSGSRGAWPSAKSGVSPSAREADELKRRRAASPSDPPPLGALASPVFRTPCSDGGHDAVEDPLYAAADEAPSALALSASNSAWVMVPLSSNPLAFSISVAAPPVPAVRRT